MACRKGKCALERSDPRIRIRSLAWALRATACLAPRFPAVFFRQCPRGRRTYLQWTRSHLLFALHVLPNCGSSSYVRGQDRFACRRIFRRLLQSDGGNAGQSNIDHFHLGLLPLRGEPCGGWFDKGLPESDRDGNGTSDFSYPNTINKIERVCPFWKHLRDD